MKQNFIMLDYPSLAAVAAVVREGTFERAAAALGITPSAVSQRVRGLEERLGAILIVRGQPCQPTALGRTLCAHLDRVRLLEHDLAPALGPAAGAGERLTVPVAVNADSLATWFPTAAAAFARASLEAAARGERIVFGAFVDGVLASTVTLLLALPENQPHRAEIAKMMTAPAFRGRGLARALLIEAERQAAMRGRTLLVLDTAEQEGAAGLYEKAGFVRVGAIPDFALKPHGGLTATLLYVKRLAPAG